MVSCVQCLLVRKFGHRNSLGCVSQRTALALLTTQVSAPETKNATHWESGSIAGLDVTAYCISGCPVRVSDFRVQTAQSMYSKWIGSEIRHVDVFVHIYITLVVTSDVFSTICWLFRAHLFHICLDTLQEHRSFSFAGILLRHCSQHERVRYDNRWISLFYYKRQQLLSFSCSVMRMLFENPALVSMKLLFSCYTVYLEFKTLRYPFSVERKSCGAS